MKEKKTEKKSKQKICTSDNTQYVPKINTKLYKNVLKIVKSLIRIASLVIKNIFKESECSTQCPFLKFYIHMYTLYACTRF